MINLFCILISEKILLIKFIHVKQFLSMDETTKSKRNVTKETAWFTNLTYGEAINSPRRLFHDIYIFVKQFHRKKHTLCVSRTLREEPMGYRIKRHEKSEK